MEFLDALAKRRNTSSWSEEVPSRGKIDAIVDALHDFSPSKQSGVRYNLYVYRNDNEDVKMNIYKGVRGATFEEKPTGRYNPQVLAPWLLILTDRKNAKPNEPDVWMDLGIATATIAYAAANLGLDTGLCRCMTYADEYIVPTLKFRPGMLIGVGHATGDEKYYCPVYKEMRENIPKDEKPNKDVYIHDLHL